MCVHFVKCKPQPNFKSLQSSYRIQFGQSFKLLFKTKQKKEKKLLEKKQKILLTNEWHYLLCLCVSV